MTKRRRPTLVREEERADILTLHSAGYCQAEVSRLLDRSEATIAKVIAEHRKAEREAHEAEYKDMYKVAAKVASSNGDHKPALEWLDRYGAIPESSRQRTAILQARVAAEGQMASTKHLQAGSASAPTINIGFAMPSQLPPAVSQAPIAPSKYLDIAHESPPICVQTHVVEKVADAK